MKNKLAKIPKEELLMWVSSYSYEEDDGIGSCNAAIFVRDRNDDLRYTFGHMSRDEKKAVMCDLIQKVAYPCEDYADDFDDPESPFYFRSWWDEDTKTVNFEAEFRV